VITKVIWLMGVTDKLKGKKEVGTRNEEDVGEFVYHNNKKVTSH